MRYTSILKYIAIFVSIAAAGFLYELLNNYSNILTYRESMLIALGFALIILGFGGYAALNERESKDVESVRQKRAALERQYEKVDVLGNQHTTRPDIFYTTQTSLNQLEEYYLINKSQARKTFTASIIAVSVGMVSLVFGVWQIYSNNLIVGALPTIVGVLGQFIGAGYFYLHRVSINQLNMYFRQLTNLQDRMLAIYLCLDLNDEKQKSEIMEEIIMFLLKNTIVLDRQSSTFSGRK